MMKRKLVVTADGSHTLLVEELKEHYHSTHGALQESMHIYIGYGLKPLLAQNKPLHIFEMGFGTGLNALLTILESGDTPINYTTVEAFPLKADEVAALNYPAVIDHPTADDWFQLIHTAPWGRPVNLKPTFILEKLHAGLEDLNFPGNSFDLVYFDAFAPNIQPELWTPEVFGRIHAWMNPGAVLVTYSAKGALKRTLAALGFETQHPPGPPGKHEITVAVKMI